MSMSIWFLQIGSITSFAYFWRSRLSVNWEMFIYSWSKGGTVDPCGGDIMSLAEATLSLLPVQSVVEKVVESKYSSSGLVCCIFRGEACAEGFTEMILIWLWGDQLWIFLWLWVIQVTFWQLHCLSGNNVPVFMHFRLKKSYLIIKVTMKTGVFFNQFSHGLKLRCPLQWSTHMEGHIKI